METRWGLSETELTDICFFPPMRVHPNDHLHYMRLSVQATLHHVYEEGEKPCREHPRVCADEDGAMTEYVIPHRFDCPKCRAELRKEAGL